MVGLIFLPKILGPWWGPTKAVSYSVNTDRVGILIGGSWDTFNTACHKITCVNFLH